MTIPTAKHRILVRGAPSMRASKHAACADAFLWPKPRLAIPSTPIFAHGAVWRHSPPAPI